jgi:hypothetical protein
MFSGDLFADLPVPWDDRAWIGTLLVAIGDAVVIVGVFVAYWIYHRQNLLADSQRRESTLAHLEGVRDALREWHDNFFNTPYKGQAALDRAELDFNLVMKGNYMTNYRVATEPVVSLIQPPADLWPFSRETVRTANVALSRMTVFNQLVQQQTDFIALNTVELRALSKQEPETLETLLAALAHPPMPEDDPRRPIAEAAKSISAQLHGIIDDAAWYHGLRAALDENIDELTSRLARPAFPWRRAVPYSLLGVLVVLTLGAALLGISDGP